MELQALLDSFYSIDNLVSIDIAIPATDWTNLRTAGPQWGWRADATVEQVQTHKYDWFAATSVSISGTKFPAQPKSFNGIAIIKKSFGGSQDPDKPSLKLDFTRTKTNAGKMNPSDVQRNATDIQKLIGAQHLTLNNCKQDDSYVRQPLGYQIFRQGGIPAARCNLAKVTINGKSLGIFVNLEQIREPYVQRNFGGNDKGNLYETEWRYDLDQSNFDNQKMYNQDGFSNFKDQKDLVLAIKQLGNGMQGLKQVVDDVQLMRVLAMQAIVKHWDGYPNNTYIYNDVVAVANPQIANVRLKLIPSGIDAIFPSDPTKSFEIKREGVLSQIVLGDPNASAQLKTTLKDCLKIFQGNLDANLKLIDKMADLIKNAKAPDPSKQSVDLDKEIKFVKDEMGRVQTGIPPITA